MTVYVDDLYNYRELMGRGLPGLWCHMITDGSLDELHDFAMRVGICPHHFQNHPRHPHYDLTPASRAIAVVLGAVTIDSVELARILDRIYPTIPK